MHTRTLTEELPPPVDRGPLKQLPALVVLWSRDEGERIGEVLLLSESGSQILGRGGRDSDDPHPRLEPLHQRPGQLIPRPPLASPRLSRVQLLAEPSAGGILLENQGRAPMYIDGEEREVGLAPFGSVVEIGRQLSLWVTRRPAWLPSLDLEDHAFGTPDALGIVGEAPCVWELRGLVGFVAARVGHALVAGPSGTGKELVASALHHLSTRTEATFVARNAATLPEGLIDAELFGHVQDYPNAGMPARPGLVGRADGGTLFLDEIGEMSSALQTHLLRVLDHGEYQRLGESKTRRSNFRLVAATNRDPAELKFDLVARLPFRIPSPSLDEHREDIPLLLLFILRRIGETDRQAVIRFFPDGDLAAAPRVQLALVRSLVQHAYTTHVRELERLLWTAIAGSAGETLCLPSATATPSRVLENPSATVVDPNSLSARDVQDCLDRHRGVQEKVWKELGLASRHVLARLIRRHGLVVRRPHD